MKKALSIILCIAMLFSCICFCQPMNAPKVETAEEKTVDNAIIAEETASLSATTGGREYVPTIFEGFSGTSIPSGMKLDNVASSTFSNGIAEIRSTSTTETKISDPYITYNVSFSTADYSEIRIRMKHELDERTDKTGNLTQVFFIGEGLSISEGNSIKYAMPISTDGEYVTYSYKIDTNANLKDKNITQLRLDFVNSSGTVWIDYVMIVPRNPNPDIFFGFDTTTEGWGHNNITNNGGTIAAKDGTVTGTIGTATNSLIYNNSFNYKGSDYPKIYICTKYENVIDNGANALLYTDRRDKDGNVVSSLYASTNHKDNSVTTSNNGKYVIQKYDFSSDTVYMSNYVNQSAYNIINKATATDATPVNFAIDYILFKNANSNMWTFDYTDFDEGVTLPNHAVKNDGTVQVTYTSSLTNVIYLKNLNVNASDYAGIEYVIKYNITSNDPEWLKTQVLYSGKTSSGTSFEKNESNAKSMNISQTTGDNYELVFLDLSDATNWDGSTITELMLKPIRNYGSYEIDSIRLVPYKKDSKTPLNADNVTVGYSFENDAAGTADGKITINPGEQQDTATIESVSLHWATKSGDTYTELADYTTLKTLTTDEIASGVTFNKDLLIPEGATALIAKITDCEKTFVKAFDIPAAKQSVVRGEPLYTAAFISDTHIGNNGAETAPTADRHIPTQQQIDELADFVVINGDLVQWYGAYSQDVFVAFNQSGSSWKDNGKTLQQVLDEKGATELNFGTDMYGVLRTWLDSFNVPVYAVQGNHDVRDADKWSSVYYDKSLWNNFLRKWISDSNAAKYKNKVTITDNDNYYATEINGHSYIFLEIPRNVSPYYTFGDQQLVWLDKKLFENEATGKPTFVFAHVPTKGSPLNGSYFANQIGDNEALIAILEKHPTAIYVSGHTHFTFDTSLLSSFDGAQSAPSYVHDGGITGVNYFDNDDLTGKELSSNNAQGVIVEVYDDCIILNGRNFTTKKWVSRGLTYLTLKANNPVNAFDVKKITGQSNTELTVTNAEDGVTYEMYLDGVLSDGLTVANDFAGYIAVRAKDANGNYLSQLYEGLSDITEYIASPEITSQEIRLATAGKKFGIRNIAQVDVNVFNSATEVGFIASLQSLVGNNENLTFNLEQSKYVSGKCKAADINNVIWGYNGENPLISGVLTDITGENYETDFVVRPYVLVDGVYYYGQVETINAKTVAQNMLATQSNLSEDEKASLNEIISYNLEG